MEEITTAVRVIGGADRTRGGRRPPTVLELRDTGCASGPDRRLERVDLQVAEKDLHLLIGERGAGKSTVLELFAGLATPDRGQLLVRNWPTWIGTPGDALDLAIGHVAEEPSLVGRLTVAETVVLGAEPGRAGHLAMRRARGQVAELAARLGVAVEPRSRISDLSLGQRRLASLLGLAWRGVEVLLLDEPTTGLGSGESAAMITAIDSLRSIGRCLLIASSSPGELLDLASGITVLRQGRSVATMGAGRRRAAELAGEAGGPAPAGTAAIVGETMLQVKGVWVAEGAREPVAGVDLDVHDGEIHGLIDTTGDGALALVDAIAGFREFDGGRVYLGNDDLTMLSVRARRALGLGYLPPADGPGGLVGSLRLWENTALGPRRRGGPCPPGPTSRRALAAAAMVQAARVGVDAHPRTLACRLSRGERQLLALARELDGPPGLLLAACPTSGLGRADAERVWARLREARDQGSAVLLATSDAQELLAVADRVTVMADGRVAGELDGRWLSESELARAVALSPAGLPPGSGPPVPPIGVPPPPGAAHRSGGRAESPSGRPLPPGPVPGWVR